MAGNTDKATPEKPRRTYIALEHVLRFLAYGKNLGLPVDGLCAFYDIDFRRDTDKPGYVPGHVWEIIVILGTEGCKRLGDPLPGMSAANGLGNSFMGLWSFIAEKSDTLGKALEIAATYQRLHANTFTGTARSRPGYLDIIITPHFKSPEASANAAVFYLIQLDRFVKHCTGEARCVIESVHFQHAPPETPALLNRYLTAFNCPVHFNAQENFMRIPARVINLPLITADVLLQTSLEQRAREQLTTYELLNEDVEALARRHLRTLIGSGHASKEALAVKLAMSPRVLLRKLQAAGTTYRALSHEVRLEQAKQYLTQPALPLAFISTHLGFKDPQSFSRWFTDQTGEAPGAYRNLHLQN